MLTSRLLNVSLLIGWSLVLALPLLARGEERKDAAPTTKPSGDATGTWKWEFEGPGGQIEFVLKLKQDGDKLAGSVTGFQGQASQIQDGKITDGRVSFKVVRDFNGQTATTTYTATLSGNSLKGKSETVFTREFEAKRGVE